MKISPVLGKLEGYYMQRLTRCIKLTNFSYKTNKSVNQSITTWHHWDTLWRMVSLKIETDSLEITLWSWPSETSESKKEFYEKLITGFQKSWKWRYQCDALTIWAIKPLKLGAGHLWVCTGISRSRVQTPLKSWIFQASICNCINCAHHCEDHSLLDFTSTVQYMKYFIYHFR